MGTMFTMKSFLLSSVLLGVSRGMFTSVFTTKQERLQLERRDLTTRMIDHIARLEKELADCKASNDTVSFKKFLQAYTPQIEKIFREGKKLGVFEAAGESKGAAKAL